jgi:hypothetical protein
MDFVSWDDDCSHSNGKIIQSCSKPPTSKPCIIQLVHWSWGSPSISLQKKGRFTGNPEILPYFMDKNTGFRCPDFPLTKPIHVSMGIWGVIPLQSGISPGSRRDHPKQHGGTPSEHWMVDFTENPQNLDDKG